MPRVSLDYPPPLRSFLQLQHVRLSFFLDKNMGAMQDIFSWQQIKDQSPMKKKQQQQQLDIGENGHELEVIKAVAQAWYGNSSSSKSSANEFDAHRQNFKNKPSRFKLEAIRKASTNDEHGTGSNSSRWDFGQSLWDSYEIVTISRKLERGLVLDHTVSAEDEAGHVFKKRKESKNSLRNILNRMSSRRFNEAYVPQEE